MKKLIDYKSISIYEPIQNFNNLFEVRFNSNQTADMYQLFTEMVVSVYSDEYRVYLIMNDAKYDDTTVFDEFVRENKNIDNLEVYLLDRSGEIIQKILYKGWFDVVSLFKLSYLNNREFIAIFTIDKKEISNL